MRDVAGLLTRRVLRYGQPESMHALFDVGGGKNDADARALMGLADASLPVSVYLDEFPEQTALVDDIDQFKKK